MPTHSKSGLSPNSVKEAPQSRPKADKAPLLCHDTIRYDRRV